MAANSAVINAVEVRGPAWRCAPRSGVEIARVSLVVILLYGEAAEQSAVGVERPAHVCGTAHDGWIRPNRKIRAVGEVFGGRVWNKVNCPTGGVAPEQRTLRSTEDFHLAKIEKRLNRQGALAEVHSIQRHGDTWFGTCLGKVAVADTADGDIGFVAKDRDLQVWCQRG